MCEIVLERVNFQIVRFREYNEHNRRATLGINIKYKKMPACVGRCELRCDFRKNLSEIVFSTPTSHLADEMRPNPKLTQTQRVILIW